MSKKPLISLMLLLSLTSCALTGRGTEPKTIGETVQAKPIIIDTACSWVRPIFISKTDVLSEGTARQILAHNRTVAKTCPSDLSKIGPIGEPAPSEKKPN